MSRSLTTIVGASGGDTRPTTVPRQGGVRVPFSRSGRGSIGLALCLGSLLLGALQALGAERASIPSLEEFKLISERNIFNPNRSPRSARTEVQTVPERPPRTESLALLGTLSYEKGEFAVFGGSESGFRQVLKVSDTVAGLKIEAVRADAVELEQNGRKIKLPVGMQLERRGEGEWTLAGAAQPSARSSLASVTTNRSESTGPGEQDDVLKRMLQKRAQELNNEN